MDKKREISTLLWGEPQASSAHHERGAQPTAPSSDGVYEVSIADLGGLLDQLDLAETEEPPGVRAPARGPLAASDAVRTLSRALIAQQVEVVAKFAAEVLRDPAMAGRTSGLRATVEQLKRLPESVGDDEFAAQFRALEEIIDGLASPADRHRRLSKLRRWVTEFATIIGGDEGARMRRIVEFERGSYPLLDHLRVVRGVGQRRLESLYAAGLTTAQQLANAAPDDLVSMFGFPPAVAERVVAASHAFDVERRQRLVRDLGSAAENMVAELKQFAKDDPLRGAMVASVRAALALLEETQRESAP